MNTTKVGSIIFNHHHNYTGEVEIVRGSNSIKVSFEALEKIVSDKVRQKAIERIELMKPAELLSLPVKK